MSPVRIIQAMARKRLIQSPPAQGSVLQFTEICKPCSEKRPAKYCLGWKTVIPEQHPLRLGQFLDKKTPLHIELSAQLDYRRDGSANVDEWQADPLRSANITIKVVPEGGGHDGSVRYHLDLANAGQEGSIWHLQVGGKGDKLVRLDLPRWGSGPMDVTLALDTIIYNYRYSAWVYLQRDGMYRRTIMESEDLIMRAWYAKIAGHFSLPAEKRSGSILALVDNMSEATSQ